MRTIAVLIMVLMCGCERSSPPPAPAPAEKTAEEKAHDENEMMKMEVQPFEKSFVTDVYPCGNGSAYVKADFGLWFVSGKNAYRVQQDDSDPTNRMRREQYEKLMKQK